VRRHVKPLVFVLCALPLAWLLARAFGLAGASLGTNPIDEIMDRLGEWGLRLLLATLLVSPLAVTSTAGWMRRLGRRWHWLHQLIYPAAILGCAHFWWQVKADWREPAVYAIVLATLLAWRIRRARGRRSRANGTARLEAQSTTAAG